MISAWAALRAYAQPVDLRAAFAADPQRAQRFSQQAPHVFADWSKGWITVEIEQLLLELARQTGVQAQRDAMLAGARVNRSEHRAALHTLLRAPAGFSGWPNSGAAARDDGIDWPAAHRAVLQTRQAMLDFAQALRGDRQITDVVNLGIGGSDLGPKMVVRALQSAGLGGPQRIHFVANLDGHELAAVLAQCQPRHTLFLVASKTFTTLETMRNAQSARQWFLNAMPAAALARHFVALTGNPGAARDWGMDTLFEFEDWVGGRYSLWSAVGLSIAIAAGPEAFEALLAGAHEMDLHFAHAPLQNNLPVRLGLLDLCYRSLMQLGSRCVVPYHAGLAHLVGHLQQLEMESNGKSVTQTGQAVAWPTAPVVWGQCGTNGQHAFFEQLHQGPDVLPAEFIAVRQPAHGLDAQHHQHLLANALAQAQALMQGSASTAAPHQRCPGNRPSTFLLLQALTPASLGALIALYEHRVFVSGAVWGINSFDQWGVELGKQIAHDLHARLVSGNTQGLDASTAGLLGRLSAAR